ncbi:MAG TPA: methyl-accepting chemotaxis protein, partial [Burkholderiales bacterium]|nr:methyl-accepting chemotaxis protein [Burkholderiales bacterium]
MRFANLKVATRLALGFSIVVLGALVLAGAGWYGIQRQSEVTSVALDRDMEFARSVAKMRTSVQMMRRFEKEMLLGVGNPEALQEARKNHGTSRGEIDELLATTHINATSDEERDRLDQLASMLQNYDGGIETVYALIAQNVISTPDQAHKKIEEFNSVIRETETVMDNLYAGANTRIESVKPALARIQNEVVLTLLIVAAVVLGSALVVSVLTSRSIAGPVAMAVRVAESLAKGDLAVKVEPRSRDEIGRLMFALRDTVQQLATIVGRIKGSSDMVATASREIAQANSDLSSRTERQASALEETSSSMEEMTATVGQNAQNAEKANELAAQASSVATRGGEVVRAAVNTMNGITESSKKIADITSVIDGIAFQTNILALNAAVEAARAGEQGRGFAVVASEVRSLAQRSAAAAKEIKQLINESVSKVDAGSRQVNDAGRTMDEIVDSVSKVSSLIAEITAASREQAQGIAQVSETVTQLEKVTQQNAAMVEEASAAAGSLEDQSRALGDAVSAFRLASDAQDGGTRRPVPEPTQAPPQPQAQPQAPMLAR